MKISILGAGVGGLSSAIALKQKGFDVDLYERDPAVRNIGAGIVCWPNASFVLDEFRLLDKIRHVSGQPTSMDRISHLGESLGSLDIRQINHLMGYDSFSILRRDLMDILVSRVRDLGIDIHFSHELTGFETVENGKVLATFGNGKKILSGMLVGADGRMNSITRQFVCHDNKPVYQKFVNWIGVFESKEGIFEELSIKDFWGVGERFGIVPVNATSAYWAGGVAAPEIGLREPEKYKAELLNLFSKWPDPIPEIIRGTPQEAINKIYVHDQSPVEVWHRDNVLMIGDAAHAPLPTSGQGACQALEDAWHLANLLEEGCSNIAETFSSFARLRHSKTTGIIMSGRQLASSLFNSDPEFCRQRNESSQHADFASVAAGMARGWMGGLPISDRPSLS
ncbi:MAG: FAD-dependent monooxygenase [Acidiferrobacterales bacterium]|nr:FAD-dependent monooxygenase [Acidiferrobacterales bacterium]